MIALGIVGLLAVVMIPKFLQAQTRTMITRTYRQLDQVRIAVNAYRLEHNEIKIPDRDRYAFFRLTSPVPYLESIETSIDPFLKEQRRNDKSITLIDIMFLSFDLTYYKQSRPNSKRTLHYYGRQFSVSDYIIWSVGPVDFSDFSHSPYEDYDEIAGGYSPTNGLLSAGNLYAIDSGLLK